MLKRHPHQAKLAIFLIVAAANLGIVARLFVPGSTGQFVFVLTRIWILVLPLLWFLWVEKGTPSISFPSKQQGVVGVISGTLMVGIILSAYWFVGRHWINPIDVQLKAQQVGIARPLAYSLGACYFTFINSLVEEYIWRWFIGRQCEVLFPKIGALSFAALCFTLHHIIALTAYVGSWLVVVAASLGVFMAGALWSWCYLTYRSLWACYISHLMADLAIALVGWHLLFGST